MGVLSRPPAVVGGTAPTVMENLAMAAEPPDRDPREMNARLRELMAIPERLRTDEQWDEIIEIEISQQQGKFNQQQGKASGNPGKRHNPGPMRQSEHKSSHKGYRKGPMKSGRS